MTSKSTVLIVGEGAGISRIVSALGHRPIVVARTQEALAKRESLSPALVLLNLPGVPEEPAFLHALSKGGTPVLVFTDSETPPRRVSRNNNQKVQILTRPVRDADLQAAVRTALEGAGNTSRAARSATETSLGVEYLTEYAPLFVHSEKMQAIKEIIEQVAPTNATVLIRGESGVGKDLVARALHAASPRRHHPFVRVNCATFPPDLLESELFGHEKGAFTGAYQRKLGKFEAADHGTFFLDEIGDLPVALQAKLLHVLQDREFARVGGRGMIRVDVRVLAATNRNLETALTGGQFREDLYYRLNVVEIAVPPLRERKEEIPHLVRFFLNKFDQQGEQQVELTPETMALLTDYPWPGNVRELENMVRRLVVLGTIPQILKEILAHLRSGPLQPSGPMEPDETRPLPSPLDAQLGLREVARRAAQEAERKAIREILNQVHWNRSKAARLLKVSYKTLLAKITECGLIPKEEPPRS